MYGFYIKLMVEEKPDTPAFNSIWWLRMESNHRHRDFQSLALPTELQSQMAVPTRIELAIFCVTGRRDNRYTTGPFGCGGWIWTNDLRVMSPTSYQAAPLRDIKYKWRRKRDSNPRAVSDLPVFKTGPFNQTWVFLHIYTICLFRRQMNYIISFFLMSTHFIRKYYDFYKKTPFSHQNERINTIPIVKIKSRIRTTFNFVGA